MHQRGRQQAQQILHGPRQAGVRQCRAEEFAALNPGLHNHWPHTLQQRALGRKPLGRVLPMAAQAARRQAEAAPKAGLRIECIPPRFAHQSDCGPAHKREAISSVACGRSARR